MKLGLSLFMLLLAAGCHSATRAPATVASTPAPAPSASTSPPDPYANVVVRVYTTYETTPHYFKTVGKWYRRADTGFEVASCTFDRVHDAEAHDSAPQPMCSSWTAVETAMIPAVERAASAGAEINCRLEGDLCKDLGLQPDIGVPIK